MTFVTPILICDGAAKVFFLRKGIFLNKLDFLMPIVSGAGIKWTFLTTKGIFLNTCDFCDVYSEHMCLTGFIYFVLKHYLWG